MLRHPNGLYGEAATVARAERTDHREASEAADRREREPQAWSALLHRKRFETSSRKSVELLRHNRLQSG